MKKLTSLLAIALMLCLVLGGVQTAAASETKKAGFLVPYTSNSFMAMLAEEFKKAYEGAGYQFEVAVADGDARKQIEQAENMITMQMNVLVVMSVDPTAMTDVLNRAGSQGIKVIDFTTRTGAEDVFVGADEHLVGETVAEMASEWVDAAFPDAADGTVQAAILEFRDTPEAVERSEGLKTLPTLNAKINLKKVVTTGNTTDAARQAAENLLLTDPDLNLVLTYNSGMSLGVNAAVMTPGSPIQDKAQFAVFGADNDAEALSAVRGSANNDSVLRGVTQLGGNIVETIQDIVGYSDKLLAGESLEDDYAPVYKITAENADEFIQ